MSARCIASDGNRLGLTVMRNTVLAAHGHRLFARVALDCPARAMTTRSRGCSMCRIADSRTRPAGSRPRQPAERAGPRP